MTAMTDRADAGAGAVRSLGVTGAMALSGSVAGGVLAAGFLLAGLAVSGGLRSSHLLVLGTTLYAVGALAGFLHGAVLGYFGRESGTDAATARAQLVLAAVRAPLPLACGWAVSGWIAMVAGNILLGNVLLLVGSGFSLAAGVFIIAVAANYALAALRNAYARWPERVTGTAVVLGGFLVLEVLFAGMPAAAFGGSALSAAGALAAAGGVTVWVVGPAATMALRRRPRSTSKVHGR